MKPSYGGFRSETATWIQKWFKMSVGTSLESSDIIVFQGGGDGRGYRNMYKIPGAELESAGLIYIIYIYIYISVA